MRSVTCQVNGYEGFIARMFGMGNDVGMYDRSQSVTKESVIRFCISNIELYLGRGFRHMIGYF